MGSRLREDRDSVGKWCSKEGILTNIVLPDKGGEEYETSSTKLVERRGIVPLTAHLFWSLRTLAKAHTPGASFYFIGGIL